MSSTIGFRPARNLAGGSRYIETQPVGDALRTLGTLNESLPEDTIPPLAGSIDEIDALNLPPVLTTGSVRIATLPQPRIAGHFSAYGMPNGTGVILSACGPPR